MFELSHCLSPDAGRNLSEGSIEREWVSLSLRQLWHQVFDPCPKLLNLFPPDGKSLLEPFLRYAEEQQLSMDWTMHLHLLSYIFLSNLLPRDLIESFQKELVAASAARWAMTDLSAHRMVLIRGCGLPEKKVIGACKSHSFRERRKVFSAEISDEWIGEFASSFAVSHLNPTTKRVDWSAVFQGSSV